MKQCITCGVNLTGRKNFCDRKCWSKHYSLTAPSNKECPVCEKLFTTPSPTKKYCSAECREIGMSKAVTCRNCEKVFTTKTNSIYCSSKCSALAHVKKDIPRPVKILLPDTFGRSV